MEIETQVIAECSIIVLQKAPKGERFFTA